MWNLWSPDKVDHVAVNIPVAMLYCYHRYRGRGGDTGRGRTGSRCLISYDCVGVCSDLKSETRPGSAAEGAGLGVPGCGVLGGGGAGIGGWEATGAKEATQA